jgi:hypothetical protein
MNLRTILLSLAILAPAASGLMAQDQSHVPGTMNYDVGLGMSFPKGDFSSITPGNPQSGGARRGPCIGVDATYDLTDNLGLSAGTMFSFNDVDGRVFGLPSAFTVNTNSWRTIWLVAGPSVAMRLSGGAVLEVLGQVGMLAGTSPEVSFDYANQHLYQGSSSSTAAAYRLGIGLVYRERGIFTLRYMGASPDYAVSATNGASSVSAASEQPTSMLVFTVGMRF